MYVRLISYKTITTPTHPFFLLRIDSKQLRYNLLEFTYVLFHRQFVDTT